jgi:5-formyltetrahydrofolate cyclo-ligase
VKSALRDHIRQRLDRITPAVAGVKSLGVCLKVMAQPEFREARSLMIYLATPEEVDLSALAARAWQEGKTVAAPRVDWKRRRMTPVAMHSLEKDIVETRYGLREPAEGEALDPAELDLVVVPAMAYDRKGNRLGRGGGFYDRFLGDERFHGAACGVAFNEQLVDRVPATKHDIPVDLIITDEHVICPSPA